MNSSKYRSIYENLLRQYLSLIFIPLIVLGLCLSIILVANYLFLNAAGELLSLDDVVQKQLDENAIYGTALHSNVYGHKLALVQALKPDLLVVGSSRTLQFRKEYFSPSFVCACLTSRNLADVESFLHDALAIHKPKEIIVGLDYWWFLRDYPEGPTIRLPEQNLTSPTLFHLLRPIQWLWNNELSFEQYIAGFIGNLQNFSRRTHFKKIGLSAILKERGIRNDGSMVDTYKTSGAFPERRNHDFFRGYLDIIKRGEPPFQRGSVIPTRIERLLQLFQRLKEQDVNVIAILLPFPPTVSKALLSNPKYRVIDDLRARLSPMPFEYYDFLDGGRISTDDCEYLDARHAGDVAIMRMLSLIAEHSPSSRISAVTKAAILKKAIRDNAGRLIARFNQRLYDFDETDYLGLGCTRTTPST